MAETFAPGIDSRFIERLSELPDLRTSGSKPSGRGVVVLVDEYDKPLLQALDSQIGRNRGNIRCPLS